MADREQDPMGDAPINPTSGLRENRSGIVDGATGAGSQARKVAQSAGGTGTGGHAGTGAEDQQATPGRVSAGSTGGGGFAGGAAMGDEGIGDETGGNAQGPRKGMAG